MSAASEPPEFLDSPRRGGAADNAGMSKVTPDQAGRYDTLMARLEQRYFPTTRAWVCGRAVGETLEIAVGTGLNLPHYPGGVRLTAVDREASVLDFARIRARALQVPVTFGEADATSLPYPDGVFDSVVCTFALCEVRSERAAIDEALRVLRPGGRLLLADHIAASSPLVRVGQHLLELLTIPASGEHFTRRPSRHLASTGVEIVDSDRFTYGAIEQVHARKPLPARPAPSPR